jgi:hypothetical protein
MITIPVGMSSEVNSSRLSESGTRIETLGYFILTVLGFSFWFFMAVPFASHRETYWWLGMVHSRDFTEALGFISSTYRPLAQATTWLAYMFLDPSVFPTSVLRQALLQGFIYGLFVVAWWLIYSAAPERRLFALVALFTGGVFFSGYVHLFHVYGLFYVPVIVTLGALLRVHASGTFERRELWFAVVATMLVFWHPFATALFVGFYFGFCLDTFRQRSRAQHVQAVLILLAGMTAIAVMVVIFPRITTMVGTFPRTASMSVDTRFFGFLESYQTNEVNRAASVVAFLLAQMAAFSMGLSPKLKSVIFFIVSALSVVFLVKSIPLLFLWVFVALMKLLRLRCWRLFFLMLTATLLPFGGGIGSPMYALFAIIVAAYVTTLGWTSAENALSFIKPRYIAATVAAAAVILVMVRAGIHVPVLTRVATPLLAEREKTYQLEGILTRLHNSDYCGYEVAFVENAGSPVEDPDSAINRRGRPPAALPDVQLFWQNVLRCPGANTLQKKTGTAFVTFGGQQLANADSHFKVAGKYAGDAAVWIEDSK